MSILHTYHSKLPFRNIKGKPYITVSARGISNGLSDIYNDGADFGPDTLLNANSPNQYGPPYTQTAGIQEAINYVLSLRNSNGNPFPEIVLLPGYFIINDNATIWINNGTSPWVDPSGLHIRGVSNNPYTCVIVKENSLPSPIISFTNTYFNSSSSSNPRNLIFENFSAWYKGPGANATAGVTMFDLSIPEIGGTRTSLSNLRFFTSNPITGEINLVNNTILDISGQEDSTLYNVYVENSGWNYETAITVPPLRAYAPLGNVIMYSVEASGIDVEAQLASIINSTIGTSGGPGIIYRPSISGATLNLQGTYFNGYLTRLITIQPMYSTGWMYQFQVNLKGALLFKNSVGNTDYMIEPNSSMYGLWDFTDAVILNGNTSYSLYLFDPNVASNINNEFINLYTHSTNNSTNIILNTESSTAGTTAGTVTMRFISYLLTYKKLIISLNNYENDTTTNQTIDFPLPFISGTVITSGNNTGLTISTTSAYITINAPNSTTTYSGIIIVEGY